MSPRSQTLGEVEKVFGVLVISLRKWYETLSNTLSRSGQSDLDWRELAQEFGGTVDGGVVISPMGVISIAAPNWVKVVLKGIHGCWFVDKIRVLICMNL